MSHHRPRSLAGSFGKRAFLTLVLAVGFLPGAHADEAVVPPASMPPEETSSAPREAPSGAPPAPSGTFPDVPASHPAAEAIRWAVTEGIVQGYDDGTFQPSRPISRVEALKVLFLAFGPAPTDASGADFPDLAAGAWYLPYVATAERDGVVHGYTNGTFGPDRTVTRVELLKMAFRVHGGNIYNSDGRGQYSDTPSGRWFVPYVNLAVAQKLVDVEGTLFLPDAAMAREHVVTLLFRMRKAMDSGAMQQLPPAAMTDGKRTLAVTGESTASYYHDSLAGNGTASGQKYDPALRTCAHVSLPFGTVVSVTHVKNGKRTTCTVNDRGPYVRGRILDLSRAAFEDLSPTSAGVLGVRWSATVLL